MFSSETALAPAKTETEGLRWPINTPSLFHKPVLLEEVLDGMAVVPGGVYVDCTAGGGGHTEGILERSLPGGRALAIDADASAINAARSRLDRFGTRLTAVHGSYADVSDIMEGSGLGKADGILFDLGLSSLQLEASSRGFSFRREEPLDMRFNPDGGGPTAADLVNGLSHTELAQLLRKYGEEPRAAAIARAIVRRRPFSSAAQLARAITAVAGPSKRGRHPATRSFQALRVATNNELENLKQGLEQSMGLLKTGGRLAIISYHSLEDRIVKEAFRRESQDCVCPVEVPQCVCGHTAQLKLITRKVITPSVEERAGNPRGRSARMRVAEHL